jgi:multidrug resistance efflux pump
LAALTALAVSVIELMRTMTATVSALPGEVRATRTALVDEVRASRTDVLTLSERQLTALRHDVMAQAGEMRQTADRRLGDTLARADAALDKAFDKADKAVDTAVNTAEGLRSDLKPVLDAAQGTLHDADRTVVDLHPPLLGLVAASKVTAGETAQTMRDFRSAVPSFIAQGNTIAANVNVATSEFSGVATNLNRLTKPKWYDRLLGYGLNGVVIYRDLNPVTSLTVRGLQFLVSH